MSTLFKICIFTTVHRPHDVRVFHRQARTLAEAGYQVTLLAHADFKEQKRFGVTIKGVSRPGNRFYRLLSAFKFTWLCLKEKADIYHFHDFELLFAGFLLKLFTGKRVIYDCHENYPEAAYERAWYPDWLKPWLSKFIAFIEPLLARQLDRVVCVVPDQQERFEQNKCNTILIRNLPRTDIFENAYKTQHDKLDQLIYVGGLTMVRGAKIMVDIMVELKKSHPHLKLLLLGPFNEPYVEENIMNYIQDKNVQDVVEHISFVPHEKVPEYIVQSKVGLIPWQPNQQMLRMVFPNKVFEYMACGVPVIASDLPSMKYIFNQSKSGIIVKADDPVEYASAIRTLLNDTDKRNTLGKNGRKFVSVKYNWNLEATKLLKLYQELTVENR